MPGVSVTHYTDKIQDLGADFFAQFDVVIGGLDNIEARRWINAVLCQFVDTNDSGACEHLASAPVAATTL